MKTVSEFLDEAKEKTGSDYRTAQIMGVTRGSISNYRNGRSMPDEYAVFQLADILGIKETELFICIGFQAEKNPAKKAYWEKRAGGYANVFAIFGSAIISVMLLAAITLFPAKAHAAGTKQVETVYYVKYKASS